MYTEREQQPFAEPPCEHHEACKSMSRATIDHDGEHMESLWGSLRVSRFSRLFTAFGGRYVFGGVELYARIAGLALRRPGVIPHLVRAAWAFRARGWYRRAPFLPLPPRSYVRWRMETAYGDPEHVPEIHEIERYVVWTSRMRQLMRRGIDV